MSNYAPDPLKEQVYTNLQNVTLSTVSANDIQKLTDPTFLQATNQDALLTYNLINQASMRDGQPMPNTQKIVQATYTDNGSNDFFIPGNGEVWMLIGGDTVTSGGTGTINFQLKDEAGTLAMLFIASVNGQEPIGENSTGLRYPIYVSSTNYLVANVTSVVTSVRASLSFIRVR
jgi:hypothetical protein|tara:strand:+ start:1598 stop:2119 length:522 start_codon:yes stop_codon:yes gene_type:complete